MSLLPSSVQKGSQTPLDTITTTSRDISHKQLVKNVHQRGKQSVSLSYNMIQSGQVCGVTQRLILVHINSV